MTNKTTFQAEMNTKDAEDAETKARERLWSVVFLLEPVESRQTRERERMNERERKEGRKTVKRSWTNRVSRPAQVNVK